MLQPVLVRESDDGYELIAGERRWRAARRVGLQTIPAIVRGRRRRVDAPAGDRRERPARAAQPARGGGRVPAADRGLRAHPRRGRDRGSARAGRRSRTRCGSAAAADDPAPPEGRHAADGPRPGAARHPRPRVPGAARPARASPRISRSARSRRPSGGARSRRPTGPRRRSAPGGRLRPPGLLELEELLGDYLETRVRITMGPRHGRVQVEFANLEDLERIYRAMTQGPSAGLRRGSGGRVDRFFDAPPDPVDERARDGRRAGGSAPPSHRRRRPRPARTTPPAMRVSRRRR